MNPNQHRRLMLFIAVSLSFPLFSPDAAGQAKLHDVYEIAHADKVLDIRFSPDGNQLLSLDAVGTLKFWEVSTGKNIATMTAWPNSIVLSPDGKLLAKCQISESKESATLWDANSRKLIRSLTPDPAAPDYLPIAFTPDGKTLATWGQPGRFPQKVGNLAIKLWDVANGRNTKTFEYVDYEDKGYHPMSLSFSPDGKMLAVSGVTTGRKKVRVWNIDSGKNISNIYVDGDVISVAFSPDGKSLALAGTGPIFSKSPRIILWDVAADQMTAEMLGHTSRILRVVFSPDGKLLASCGEGDNPTEASRDNPAIIRLWDVDTGRAVAKLTGHTRDVRSVAFSPDGKLLASGSDDQSIRVWDVSKVKRGR